MALNIILAALLIRTRKKAPLAHLNTILAALATAMESKNTLAARLGTETTRNQPTPHLTTRMKRKHLHHLITPAAGTTKTAGRTTRALPQKTSIPVAVAQSTKAKIKIATANDLQNITAPPRPLSARKSAKMK